MHSLYFLGYWIKRKHKKFISLKPWNLPTQPCISRLIFFNRSQFPSVRNEFYTLSYPGFWSNFQISINIPGSWTGCLKMHIMLINYKMITLQIVFTRLFSKCKIPPIPLISTFNCEDYKIFGKLVCTFLIRERCTFPSSKMIKFWVILLLFETILILRFIFR